MSEEYASLLKHADCEVELAFYDGSLVAQLECATEGDFLIDIDRVKADEHQGHKIEIAIYGVDQNTSVECMDCNEVIVDFEKTD